MLAAALARISELEAAIRAFTGSRSGEVPWPPEKHPSPLCEELYNRAQILQVQARNTHYPPEMLKRCAHLAVRTGRSAWNSWCTALRNLLPTYRTVRDTMKKESFCVDCGIDSETVAKQIRQFAALCSKNNYDGPFFISFDATAIFPSLEIDSETHKLQGHPFVKPIHVTGLKHYQRLLKDCPRAKQLYTFCVTSMTDAKVPPIILLAFPSDDSFKATWLTRKLLEIAQVFKKHGLEVGGFSADGASKQLLAMMIISEMSKFGSMNIFAFVKFLDTLEGRNWMEDRPLMFQDALHGMMKVSIEDTI